MPIATLVSPSSFSGRPPSRLVMETSYRKVFDHHLKYSLRPFFSTNAETLAQRFSDGLELCVEEDLPYPDRDRDLYLCFQPDQARAAAISSYAARFDRSRCALANFENPIGYHFRSWKFREEFLRNFSLIFSSAGLFTDMEKHLWIPGWNFFNDFESDQPGAAMNGDPDTRDEFMVVNPISSGVEISPDRAKLITMFLDRFPRAHLYGRREIYEAAPFRDFLGQWQGEIPYSAQPYRFRNKLPVFRRYTFALVIENAYLDGYLTEKLAEPLAALTIPVYFGDPGIALLLPELFDGGVINGHDYSSPAELFAYLERISPDEIRGRQEQIRNFRHTYLNLTSRKKIWSFMLSRFLTVDVDGGQELVVANERLARENREDGRRQRRREVELMIEMKGGEPEYDRSIRHLFRRREDSGRSDTLRSLNDAVPMTGPIRIGAFISIPKNASKSVLEILELGENRDRETTGSPVIYENHQRGVVLASRHDLESLFVFCFCRNPYDRAVSWFEFHRHLPLYREKTFSGWVREGMPHHFRKQNLTDYVKEGLTPLLQYTYIEGARIDFIGRIENFEGDMRVIIDSLNRRAEVTGITQRFQYRPVKVNASVREPDYRGYYDEETRLLVNNMLRRDFEFFGYDSAL